MSQIPMTPQLAGMPQGGAPMMPPQMRQEQQQVGIANTGDLSRLPDQQLAQMANSPGNAMMQLAALSEVQKRQQARRAAQAQQAQRGMGQGTVKDQVLRGAGLPSQQATPPNPIDAVNAQPQAHGLPSLPTGQAVPQQYAGGGIVSFEGGGGVTEQEGIYDLLGRASRWITGQDYRGKPKQLSGEAYNRQYPSWQGITPPEGLGRRMAHELLPDYVDAVAPSEAAAPQGNTPPWVGAQSRMPPSNPFAQRPEGGAGIASLKRSGGVSLGGGSGLAGWVDPTAGAPAARMTPEEFDKRIEVEYERLKKLYGPDVAEQYLKQIQEERKGMDKKYEDNKYEAISRAGLAMMSGKSKHWAVNVGEGGIAGLNAFQAGRKDLDSQAAQLRREEMQAALASQQRGDMMRGQAVGRTDKADAEMRQDRNEYINKIQNWNDYGLKARELDIKMAGVNVEAMRNEILKSNNKADVMARIYQTAQQEAYDAIAKDPKAAMMSADQKAQMARDLAKDWIKNNLGLDLLQARAGNVGGTMPQRMQWPGSEQNFSRAP